MTYDDLLEFYHNDVGRLAQDLECTTQSIYMWKGKIPRMRQYQLERITKGKLKADTTFAPRKKHTPRE